MLKRGHIVIEDAITKNELIELRIQIRKESLFS